MINLYVKFNVSINTKEVIYSAKSGDKDERRRRMTKLESSKIWPGSKNRHRSD